MSNISVYRNEDKYIIGTEKAIQIKNKLLGIMKEDIHSSNQQGYKVKSLYFDSIDNEDFYTKLAGTEVRKKIRLRVYDEDDDVCKLEIKKKNGNLSNKVSILLRTEDAKKIIMGNYGILTKYFDSPEAVYVYNLMISKCYRPVALIEYDRIAFTSSINNIRVTLDMNVRSSETNFNIFEKNIITTPVFYNQTILEIKYDGKLLGYISDILKQFHLTKTSISKYCIGRVNYSQII